MATQVFKEWLAEDGGRVNQALRAEIDALPAPVRSIASHILEAGGKRLRPLLTLLFARLFGNNDPSLYRLAASMEILHAATLLHDDVLDNADRRRGKPSAHTVFGAAAVILGGDALLAHGNAIVASFQKPALTECFSMATTQTAAGEILEMDSLRDPGLELEKYIEIARGKTACLIAQSCRMGALAGGADSQQARISSAFGENMGIAFQIVDDALDFAPQRQTGKPRGGDLREGKMTPPLYLYRRSLDEKSRAEFDRAFTGGIFTPAQIEEICDACAAFAGAALARADSYLEKAGEALASLPESPQKPFLEQMLDYVRNRSK